MSGPGAVVSMVKLNSPASLSLHSPAIAITGEFLRLKRCLVLGYLVPVNSKKPERMIRQRRLSAKLRLSDLKLKTGPAFGRGAGQPNFISTSSTPLPAARKTGPRTPKRMSSARGKTAAGSEGGGVR